MLKPARVALALVFVLTCLVPGADALADDTIVFTLAPAAPTPDEKVTVGFAWRPPSSRPAPVPMIYLYRADVPFDLYRRVPATALVGSNFVVASLGKLAEGRYGVDYYDVPVPTGADEPVGYFQFSVTSKGPVNVVEFFNADLGHYFITADENEIELLDLGYKRGWVRTGLGFRALDGATLPSNALPVCRFYGAPAAGLDSHFYSQDAAECTAVAARWPGIWNLETDRAFGVEDWIWTDSSCENADHAPLFRLYNNRPDANHRYTTSYAVRDAMIAQGWILEARFPGDGYFADVISACVLR